MLYRHISHTFHLSVEERSFQTPFLCGDLTSSVVAALLYKGRLFRCQLPLERLHRSVGRGLSTQGPQSQGLSFKGLHYMLSRLFQNKIVVLVKMKNMLQAFENIIHPYNGNTLHVYNAFICGIQQLENENYGRVVFA